MHRTRAHPVRLLVFLPAFLAAPAALADANLNCDAYAGAAVAQQQQNLAQGCGFSGPAWSADFAAHRNWCLSPATKMANLTNENNARNAALAQCAAKPKLDQQACQTYANRAVTVAKAAAERSCGFKGGRWVADYATHFNWCLSASQGARDQEDKARTDQLDACAATQAAAGEQAKKDACGQYAAMAVDQQKENAGRSCGFTGGRWAGDWQAHFNWCMGVGPQTASKETAIRAGALKNDCMNRVCTTTETVSPLPPFISSTTSCRNVPKPWK
jgi:hypothetical protein